MPKGIWANRPRVRLPVEDRFWAKVERRGFDECWPWTASTNAKGYGKFVLQPGQLDAVDVQHRLAHVVAYRLVHGHWPDPCGLHGCDNPPCCNAVNPLHIHEGTLQDNNREMRERGRAAGPPIRRGERANRSRLTDEQAQEIFARYQAGGVTQYALAAEYGVSQHTVYWIASGRRSLGG